MSVAYEEVRVSEPRKPPLRPLPQRIGFAPIWLGFLLGLALCFLPDLFHLSGIGIFVIVATIITAVIMIANKK